MAADPAAGAVQINDAARPATGDEIRDTTLLIVGGGHDVAEGRDGNAMTEDDTGWGNPPDPEVAQHGEQPQHGLAGQPWIGELELDADGLPIQNRPATSQTYLIAASCLAGGLASVGLAVTEWVEYADHNGVGSLAIVGMVIGAVAGFTAVADLEKPHGWADRIMIVAAGLALIGFFSLFFLFAGLHGWGTGGLFMTGPAKAGSQAMTATNDFQLRRLQTGQGIWVMCAGAFCSGSASVRPT